MSYQTWHTYGYGICVSDIKNITVERIQTLLSCAPNYQQCVQEWLSDCEIYAPTVSDYLDFDQDFHLGLATLLQEVLQEAEDIRFVACDSFDGRDYLLLCPYYPWHIGDKERALTEERVSAILNKYVTLLTDTPEEIDYQSVENGG